MRARLVGVGAGNSAVVVDLPRCVWVPETLSRLVRRLFGIR